MEGWSKGIKRAERKGKDKKKESVDYTKKQRSLSKLRICLVWPIRVAGRFKAWVCGRSLAGVTVSNYAGARMSVSFERCFLSCRDLCVGLIKRPFLPNVACLSVIAKPR
jgi:hypothetical protein